MKTITLPAIMLLFVIALSGCSKPSGEIKVITFNIRYDNPRDSINAWPNRKAIVCRFLGEEKPDLFGLQEALWWQYEAIDSALTGYSSVAVGRDDGRKKGEMNPLFYNSGRFEYVTDSTFWLSSTPSVAGTRGWGASLPRIVTWVKLTDNKTGKPLFYFNTHFAHDSDSARLMSARILLAQVKRIAGDEKFVITGDFNTEPSTMAYSILTARDQHLIKDSFMISETAPAGPLPTFNGWSDKTGGDRIDYVFVSNGIKVKNISTLAIKEGPVFISDHWPVRAVIEY
ncbi:MAG: endonuclease/exonuclease/phosphatase family protein [Bacteroidales bacterium]